MISIVEQKAKTTYPALLNGKSFNDGHLGGCNVDGDPATHYPIMWKFLVDNLGISSIVDVGCGFGYSLDYFKTHMKLEAIGVEGSAKVAELSLHPYSITIHDYSNGPLFLTKDYDLGWSSEFLEHVPSQFVSNYMETFKSCKYVAVTYASIGQTGHNHVNENTEKYWIDIFKDNGFEYDYEFTKLLRQKCQEDFNDPRSPIDQSRVKDWTYPYHFVNKGLFFNNESKNCT